MMDGFPALKSHAGAASLSPAARKCWSPSDGQKAAAFQRLATHMDIAWDMDGTLIDHPAAPLLHRFILDTPHIRHVIVTFRSARQGTPWALLGGYSHKLGAEHFVRAIHLPDELCAGLSDETSARRGGHWPGLGQLIRPWRRAADTAHRSWKGMICQQEGITALVDDLTSLVAEGCRRHGVELFHPTDFLPAR
jgi:hypothetical protein